MVTIDKDELAAARKAVAKGVALMDEEGPREWRKLIRKDLLDLASAQTCILGQTFAGHFDAGVAHFDDLFEGESFHAETYGFEMDEDGSYQTDRGGFGYPALGRAWEEELFPEMFKVTAEWVEAKFEEFEERLPGKIAEGLRAVLRSL